MNQRYDAIVVGARCAGAPTAMLLARQGHRVLLVDRARFPSDTVSTHLVHPTGVAALRRWGLLDDLAATGCPPITRYSFDFDCAVLSGTPAPIDGVRTAYGPRRIVLDNLLVEAAARAGVEVRQGYGIEDVVRNGDRVVGIRGRARGGTAVQDRAAVVIGADGKHSAVAKAVGVPNYLEKPSLTAGYYTYWSGLGITDFRVYVRPKRAIVAVPTHDDLTLVLVGWPHAEFAANKPDIEGTYHRAVAQIPDLAERLRGGRREARFVGTGDMPNAFRTPYGPGWALVGDAGYVRDPCTAQGISDSFRDAEQITAALAEFYAGRLRFGTAMGRFHAERDAAVKPMFDFTLQLAAMEPLPAFIRGLFRSMQGSPARTEKFLGVIAGTVSPKEFFAPANLVGTFAGGLARTVPRPTFPRGAGTARQQA